MKIGRRDRADRTESNQHDPATIADQHNDRVSAIVTALSEHACSRGTIDGELKREMEIRIRNGCDRMGNMRRCNKLIGVSLDERTVTTHRDEHSNRLGHCNNNCDSSQRSNSGTFPSNSKDWGMTDGNAFSHFGHWQPQPRPRHDAGHWQQHNGQLANWTTGMITYQTCNLGNGSELATATHARNNF